MNAWRTLLDQNKQRFEVAQKKAIAEEVRQQGLPSTEEVRAVVEQAVQSNPHLKQAMADLQRKTDTLVNTSRALHDDDLSKLEQARADAFKLIEDARDIIKDDYRRIYAEVHGLLKELGSGLNASGQAELKKQVYEHAAQVRKAIVSEVGPIIQQSHTDLENMLTYIDRRIQKVDEETARTELNVHNVYTASNDLAAQIQGFKDLIAGVLNELKSDASGLRENAHQIGEMRKQLSSLIFNTIDESNPDGPGIFHNMIALAEKLVPFSSAVEQTSLNLDELRQSLNDSSIQTQTMYKLAKQFDDVYIKHSAQIRQIEQAILALKNTNNVVVQVERANSQIMYELTQNTATVKQIKETMGGMNSTLDFLSDAMNSHDDDLKAQIESYFKWMEGVFKQMSTGQGDIVRQTHIISEALEQHKRNNEQLYNETFERLTQSYNQAADDVADLKNNAKEHAEYLKKQTVDQITGLMKQIEIYFEKFALALQPSFQAIAGMSNNLRRLVNEHVEINQQIAKLQNDLEVVRTNPGANTAIGELLKGITTLFLEEMNKSNAKLEERIDNVVHEQQSVLQTVLKLAKQIEQKVDLKKKKKTLNVTAQLPQHEKLNFHPSKLEVEDEESKHVQESNRKRGRKEQTKDLNQQLVKIGGTGKHFNLTKENCIQVETSNWTNLSVQLALAEQFAAQPMSYVFGTMNGFLAGSFGGIDYVVTSKDKNKLPAEYTVPYEACIPVCGMCFASPKDVDCILRLVAVLPSALFFVQQTAAENQTYTRVFGELQKTLLGCNNALLFVAENDTDLLRFVPMQDVISLHGPSLQDGGTNPLPKDVDYISGMIRESMLDYQFPPHVQKDFQVRLRTELYAQD